MTAGQIIRRTGLSAVLLVLVVSSARADEPEKPTKPTVLQLRTTAEIAEKAGDWETAFTAYCHLFVVDRTNAEIREKLNLALRRAQQLRRHNDAQFQQFATTTSIPEVLNLFSEVMTRVPVLYVERDRSTPQVLWEHGLEELARALGNPIFRQTFFDNPPLEKLEWFRNSLRVSWAKQSITDAKSARVALRKLITSAQETFVLRAPSVLALEVICGACGGLDEYTVFLTPNLTNSTGADSASDLIAQGVYLTILDGAVVVAGIAPGSWASLHTNLRKGDVIIELNDHPMVGVTTAQLAAALRQPLNGFHVLELGPETAPVQLPVTVPSIYGTRVLSSLASKDRVGYLRLGSFTPSTPRELDEAIHSLRASGVRSVIIDLRGNMGGSFLSSVETARRLLPAGLIVTTQGQITEVNNIPFTSESGMSAHDIPLVVLIDTETASAAEVLAAALKDNNRATLIGMPTFGKGTIQYPIRLIALDELDSSGKPQSARSGAVRLTIAKLIAPRGGAINGIGITPHIMEADPGNQLKLAIEKAVELVPTLPRPMMPLVPVYP
jgi:carboxyl-terminal processing protease